MQDVVVMAVSAAVTAATMTFSITSQMFFLFMVWLIFKVVFSNRVFSLFPWELPLASSAEEKGEGGDGYSSLD